MPEKAGLLVRAADAPIDVFRTYAGPVRADFAHYRTWFGHRTFAPSDQVADYSRELDLPQFFTPAHPVSVDDVFELFRSRNEGTDWCPETTGRADVRVIGDEIQCTSHVIEVRDGVPPPFAATAWFSLGAAEHSVFLPVMVLADETAPAFAADSRPHAGFCAYDAAVAAAHFRRLSAVAELDRKLYGRGVRDYWRACEKALLAEEPKIRARLLRVYAEDPARASALLTQRTLEIQQAALADAKELFDDLAWHLTEQNHARRVNMDYHTFALSAPAPKPPFKPTAHHLADRVVAQEESP